MCVLAVYFMWINKVLRMFLMGLWINVEFSFHSVDVIHTLINTENQGLIKVLRAFTQTHSPYY